MGVFVSEVVDEKRGFRLRWCDLTGLASRAVVAADCDPLSARLLTRALTSFVGFCGQGNPEKVTWAYPGVTGEIVLELEGDVLQVTVENPQIWEQVTTEEQLFGGSGKITLHDGKEERSGPADLLDHARDLAYFSSGILEREAAAEAFVSFHGDHSEPVALCAGFWLEALPGSDLKNFDEIRKTLEAPAFVDHVTEQHPDKVADLLPIAYNVLTGETLTETPEIKAFIWDVD
jgi:hypothetical protein